MRRAILVGLAALLLAAPASAGTIVVTLGLASGKLKVSSARANAATFTVTVADGRGSGAGWTLRASRPVAVAGITARCAAGSTCTLPAAKSAPSGATVLASARGTGMGVMVLTITLSAPTQTPVGFSAS